MTPNEYRRLDAGERPDLFCIASDRVIRSGASIERKERWVLTHTVQLALHLNAGGERTIAHEVALAKACNAIQAIQEMKQREEQRGRAILLNQARAQEIAAAEKAAVLDIVPLTLRAIHAADRQKTRWYKSIPALNAIPADLTPLQGVS